MIAPALRAARGLPKTARLRTSRDFRFKVRAWFLKDTPSICTGCSNGCNTQISTYKDRVYRFLPRRNDAVNDTWICDDGRLSYHAIQSADRIRLPRLRDDAPGDGAVSQAAAPWDIAIEAAARRLRIARESRGAPALGAVASAHPTNEDLYLFLKFCREVLGVDRPGMVVPTWEPDDLLIKEEKAPNAAGARALGIGDADDARATLERCERGEVNAIVLLGADILLADDPVRVLAALSKVGTIVCIDTHESEISRIAHVVLPAQGFAEKDGTMTNVRGRVQRIRPAIRPVGEARAEREILGALASRMEHPLASASPADVLKEIAAAVPAFRGVTLERVGSQGILLGGA